MAALQYVKSFLATAAGLYAFLLPVRELSRLKPETFEACNEGCTFIRFFGFDGLPPTKIQYMPVKNDKNTSDWMPRFVFVRNGHELKSRSLWRSWRDRPANVGMAVGMSVYVLPVSAIAGRFENSTARYPSPQCPGMSEAAMQEECNSISMRGRIDNHLRLTSSKSCIVYIIGLLGWKSCKVAHDWGLFAGAGEHVTLRLGIASVVLQFIATLAALAWSMGAAETFAANHLQRNCACYYQLPGLAMFAALVSPLLMMVTLIMKVPALMRSVHYGDYLYFQQYDVPFRVVHSSCPRDPTASLVIGRLPGIGNSNPRAPMRALTWKQRVGMSNIVRSMLRWTLILMEGSTYWIAVPLFVRFVDLCFISAKDVFGGILPNFIVTSILSVGSILAIRNFVGHAIAIYEACYFYSFCTALTECFNACMAVMIPAIWTNSIRHDLQSLDGVWNWAAVGMCLLCVAKNISREFFFQPMFDLHCMQTLTWDTDMATPQKWLNFAIKHPEFELQSSVRLTQSFITSSGLETTADASLARPFYEELDKQKLIRMNAAGDAEFDQELEPLRWP